MNKDNFIDDHVSRGITDFLSARYDPSSLLSKFMTDWLNARNNCITLRARKSQTQSSEIELNAKVGGKKMMPL